MKTSLILLACLLLCFPVYANGNSNGANQDHTCQGGHNCNEGAGSVSDSGNSTNTITNSNTANGGSVGNINATGGRNVARGGSSSSDSSSSASSSNDGVNVEGDDVRSLAQFFSSSPGKDEMQIGSAIFGGLSVSNDSASNDIRQNLGAIIAANKAGLLSDSSAKHVVHLLVDELKESSKGDSCLGVRQGRKRTLSNLFKLMC